jgi:hypothetical protein
MPIDRRIERRGSAAAQPVGLPQFLPRQPLRFLPAVGAGFLGCLAGGVDLDPADFEIAIAGNRRNPAVALDLRIDRARPARERKAQRRRQRKARLAREGRAARSAWAMMGAGRPRELHSGTRGMRVPIGWAALLPKGKWKSKQESARRVAHGFQR